LKRTRKGWAARRCPCPAYDQTTGGSTFVASAPIAGKTASVSIVHGNVVIQLPDGETLPLATGTRSVPLGATVDASKGAVRMTTSRTYSTHTGGHPATSTGVFSAGLFAARQQLERKHSSHTAVTEILLTGHKNAAQKAACHQTGPPGKGIVRSLHGVVKGVYRTVAAASVTTVNKGTWTVEDRCDGTVTTVTSGTATVTTTHGRHRTRHLHAGQSLLVRARFLTGKQHAH
jgi:hypothetical protein